jgi:quinol monooxygenase YgiN
VTVAVERRTSSRFVFSLRVLPGHEAAYLDQVDALVDAARPESGLVRYEAFFAPTSASFVWLETYVEASAFGEHLENPAVVELSGSMYPHISVERVVAHGDVPAELSAAWSEQLPALELPTPVSGTRTFAEIDVAARCHHIDADLGPSARIGPGGALPRVDAAPAVADLRISVDARGHLSVLVALRADGPEGTTAAVLDALHADAHALGARVLRAAALVDADTDVTGLAAGTAVLRRVGGFTRPAPALERDDGRRRAT